MHTSVRRLMLLICALAVMCTALVVSSQAAQTKSQTKQANAKITAKQAEQIALKKFPGKVVDKTTLENEEGVWQYGVMVQSNKTLREVMVNAKTGKIDSVEVTTAQKEKTEAAKEKSAGHEKTEGREDVTK